LNSSAQHTTLQVERTLVAKDSASGQVEALPIDEELDGEPVRSIGQFLFSDGNSIEDAIEQGGRAGAEVVLFESAARGKIAIANAIDAFLCVNLFGVKTFFGDLPEIYACFSSSLLKTSFYPGWCTLCA
jgi:hypothetical protein